MEGAGCVANECDGGNPLTADFEADNVDPCDLTEVQFTSTSLGDITAYSWTFEGGTPESSDEENPLVTYQMAGVYDVTLTVTAGLDQNTITMEDYITVHNCTGIANPELNQMSITPNPGDGNFQIALPDNGTFEVLVFDITGHVVYTSNMTAAQNQLDISHLNNGVYVISANNGSTQFKERVIIK